MELNWERLAQRIKEHWFELVCIRQALAPMSIDLMVQMTANEANLENMNINPSSMTIITTHANVFMISNTTSKLAIFYCMTLSQLYVLS
ncbi:TPA: hypothetical protein ACN976_003795 [Vibrio campbellii]